jgi:hypothetical protein
MSLIPFGFWAASGGGGGAFDLLETTTLTTSAASVTFSGLGAYSDYKHLQIRMIARSGHTVNTVGNQLRFNGSTSANYSTHYLRANYDGGYIGTAGLTSGGFFGGYPYVFQFYTAGSLVANSSGAAVIDILDFSSVNKNTTLKILSGTSGVVSLTSGLWQETTPVTSINLKEGAGLDYQIGSRFSLYGVK